MPIQHRVGVTFYTIFGVRLSLIKSFRKHTCEVLVIELQTGTCLYDSTRLERT